MNKKERQRVIEEMEVRALASETCRAYLSSLDRFFTYHGGKKAEDLCIDEIKAFQRFLIKEDFAPNSIKRHLSAIRFFYRFVYERHWYTDVLPRLQSPSYQPVVLSRQEVQLMIKSVNKIFYKAILMTLYSTGMRATELRNLKVTDIDRARMVIAIKQGKGKKDRQALLSPVTLKCLESYWREVRIPRKIKSDYLFIPSNNRTESLVKPLSRNALGYIVGVALKASRIKKKLVPIPFDIALLSTF